MKLQLSRPVSILIIGAGGTGGYVIPHLYRIAYATRRKYRVVIADGDIVEKKNLIRQNFSQFDIGVNKAEAMAERYSETFGIETEYVPEYIEDEDMLCDLLIPNTIEARSQKPAYIIIGAVDNNRSRVMCHNVFNKLDDVIYIDSGNGEYTGQVAVRYQGKRKGSITARCRDISGYFDRYRKVSVRAFLRRKKCVSTAEYCSKYLCSNGN